MFSNKANSFVKKLKLALRKLPKIARSASTASRGKLLRAAATLFNHFFKALSSFGGDDPKIAEPHPPKTLVIASTIVEIVIERAVSTGIIVISCSRNKVRIVSTKDVSLSRTFSMVCLILATCVRRSFQFCDSISRLGCFPVFSSLSSSE